LRRYADPPSRQYFHRKGKPEPVFTDAVFLRDLHIVKENTMRIAPPDPQLVFLRAHYHARPALLDNERIDPMTALTRIGLRHDQVYGCRIAIGDPVLDSIQHIMIPFLDRRRPLRR